MPYGIVLDVNVGIGECGWIGTPYAFGLYGDDLKEVTGFSQTDISLVSSIGDWGLYMVWKRHVFSLVFGSFSSRSRSMSRFGAFGVIPCA